MKSEWFLAASRTGARILMREKRKGAIRLLRSFDNPEARLHTRGLVSDRLGNSVASVRGNGRHTMGGAKDPHRHVADSFARKLASFLSRERGLDRFSTLTVAAEPRLLGQIRSLVSPLTARSVRKWIPTDLANLAEHELKLHFSERVGDRERPLQRSQQEERT